MKPDYTIGTLRGVAFRCAASRIDRRVAVHADTRLARELKAIVDRVLADRTTFYPPIGKRIRPSGRVSKRVHWASHGMSLFAYNLSKAADPCSNIRAYGYCHK